jgi:hypothetical protein
VGDGRRPEVRGPLGQGYQEVLCLYAAPR